MAPRHCAALDQVNEFDKGPDTDFIHDIRAMEIDGLWADAKLVSRILIRLAGDQMVQDLALARGQKPQPGLDILPLPVPAAPLSVESDRFLNAVE